MRSARRRGRADPRSFATQPTFAVLTRFDEPHAWLRSTTETLARAAQYTAALDALRGALRPRVCAGSGCCETLRSRGLQSPRCRPSSYQLRPCAWRSEQPFADARAGVFALRDRSSGQRINRGSPELREGSLPPVRLRRARKSMPRPATTKCGGLRLRTHMRGSAGQRRRWNGNGCWKMP